MRKALFAGVLCALLLLAGCSADAPRETDDGTLHILTTTYPVYCFTTAVAEGADGVTVDLMVNQQTSCLHDYTLTVTDMKAIEGADVLVLNGAGLEDFMDDALAASDAAVIDCSEDVILLEAAGHEGHAHDTEYDPHIWMDPARAAQMITSIGDGLTSLDEANRTVYAENVAALQETLAAAQSIWRAQAAGLSVKQLVTFHDGFHYFANAFGLELLMSIEEEEGSEASAREINEIIALIQMNRLPAIFTEVNGSTATADAISRETDAAVYPLNLMMSGTAGGIQPYLDGMQANLDTLTEALS